MDIRRALGIAEQIINEIGGRKGIGDEWDSIDEEIQEEIKQTFAEIIFEGANEVGA